MLGEFRVNNSARFPSVMFALDFLSQLYHFIPFHWLEKDYCMQKSNWTTEQATLSKTWYCRIDLEATLLYCFSVSFSPATFLKRQFHPNWGHGPTRFPWHPRRPWHRAASRRRLHGRALLPCAVAHGLGMLLGRKRRQHELRWSFLRGDACWVGDHQWQKSEILNIAEIPQGCKMLQTLQLSTNAVHVVWRLSIIALSWD